MGSGRLGRRSDEQSEWRADGQSRPGHEGRRGLRVEVSRLHDDGGSALAVVPRAAIQSVRLCGSAPGNRGGARAGRRAEGQASLLSTGGGMSTERTVKAFMSYRGVRMDHTRPVGGSVQEARRILEETEPEIMLRTGYAGVTNQYMRNYWNGNAHPYSALADSLRAIMPELDRLAVNATLDERKQEAWRVDSFAVELRCRNLATLAGMVEAHDGD